MKNVIALASRTVNIQWYIFIFFLAILNGCAKSPVIKTNNTSTIITKEEFPYELVGTIHNQFLDYLVTHNINPYDFDSIMISAQTFLEINFDDYNEDFNGLVSDNAVLMEYMNLLDSSESDLEQYISENCDLEAFESEYLGIICDIIHYDYTISQKIDIIGELENEILSIETDSINAKWRLLSFVSVVTNSLLYWNQGAKVPPERIVLADAMGVYASLPQIAYASFFGPWWAVGYAAVAAGTCSYIASRD